MIQYYFIDNTKNFRSIFSTRKFFVHFGIPLYHILRIFADLVIHIFFMLDRRISNLFFIKPAKVFRAFDTHRLGDLRDGIIGAF